MKYGLYILTNCALLNIFMSIFTGCQQNSIEIHNKINLSYIADFSGIIEQKKRLFLSEFSQDIQYIPLETVQESLLGAITKITISDSCIYVSDNQKLLKFSLEGSFIKQIGKTGHGPGEYTSIADFEIDDNSKSIYISDAQIQSIFKYDTEGNFIKRIEHDLYGSQFVLLGNDRIAVFTTDFSRQPDTIVDNLVITDLNFNPITKFQGHSIQTGALSIDHAPLYVFNDKLYYKENYNDTLYFLNNNTLEPYSIITLGKHQLYIPAILNAKDVSEIQRALNEVANKLIIDYIIESKRYLFISLKYGIHVNPPRSLYILYDKNKDLSSSLIDEGLFNDIDQGVNFWPKFVYNDSILIDYRDALTFKSEMQAINGSQMTLDENNINFLDARWLADNLKENDNPIVMLLTLKE